MPEEELEFTRESRETVEMEPDDVAFQSAAVGTLSDADRELLIETQCCITGKDVKHSFCRYPDRERGTVMVMCHEEMVRRSRNGQSLIAQFEKVLEKRREAEKRTRARKKQTDS